MRKLLLLFLFGISLHGLKAQGANLKYNQALLLTSQTSACQSCWTVPSGRVWKITGLSTNSDNLSSLYLNGLEMGYLPGAAFSSSSSSYWSTRWGLPQFPLWLPAGSTLGYSSIGSNRNIAFYGIEFLEIP